MPDGEIISVQAVMECDGLKLLLIGPIKESPKSGQRVRYETIEKDEDRALRQEPIRVLTPATANGAIAPGRPECRWPT